MSSDERINAAVETLRETLERLGWEPQQLDGETIFDVDFGPPHLPVSGAVAAITLPAEDFVIYFSFGVAAAEDRFEEVAEFITRANEDLILGAFVLDYGNGHVRFRSSFSFAGTELPEKLVENAIAAGMKAVETYADPLIDVIARGKDPADAIEEVEGA
jgi:hypothetical protein